MSPQFHIDSKTSCLEKKILKLDAVSRIESGVGRVVRDVQRDARLDLGLQEHSMILREKYLSSLVRAADSRGGGGASHNPGNFAQDREKAAEAGRKGGAQSHGGSAAHGTGGAEHKSGNFADDPERAAEAGRKGGQHSHGGSAGHSTGGAEHKSGNFADDPEEAAEAGRKGGHASHSHKGT
ncbi:general stress protein [Gluconacetobacter sp. Hr-1-5]|uniref:general stress protein n=1 Tax=Gluconacetobacter sp. Hr-1-5 TaxID=3395370 RepID=UPI003B517246